MGLLDLLDYRLPELHDDAQRRALFSDLAAHFDHPAMTNFLTAVDSALREAEADTLAEIAALKEEREGLQEDLAAAQEANDELRYDVNYYREELEKCQDRAHRQA